MSPRARTEELEQPSTHRTRFRRGRNWVPHELVRAKRSLALKIGTQPLTFL